MNRVHLRPFTAMERDDAMEDDDSLLFGSPTQQEQQDATQQNASNMNDDNDEDTVDDDTSEGLSLVDDILINGEIEDDDVSFLSDCFGGDGNYDIPMDDLEGEVVSAINAGFDLNVVSSLKSTRTILDPKIEAQMRLHQELEKPNIPSNQQDRIIRLVNDIIRIGGGAIWTARRMGIHVNKNIGITAPLATEVPLEKPGETATFHHFPAMDVVKRILANPVWQEPEKLNIPPTGDPMAPYVPNCGVYSCALDGHVYAEFAKETTSVNDDEDGNDDVFNLILLDYGDGFNATKKGSKSITPHALVSANIRESFRDLSCYEIFYIQPSPNSSTSTERTKENSTLDGRGRFIRDRHRIIGVAMDDLLRTATYLFDNRWAIRIGGVVGMKRIRLRILFAKGDIDELNKLCGFYAVNGLRISRRCDMPKQYSDDPDRICLPTNQRLIAAAVQELIPGNNGVPTYDTERRKELRDNFKIASMYVVDNAYWKCPWVADNSSIYNSTPFDYLHCLYLGIFRYMAMEIRDRMSESGSLTKANNLAKTILRPLRRDDAVPRLNFNDGFTRTTKRNGQDLVGYIWGMVQLLDFDDDNSIFATLCGPFGGNIESTKEYKKQLRVYEDGQSDIMPDEPLFVKPTTLQLRSLLENALILMSIGVAHEIPKQKIGAVAELVKTFQYQLITYLPRRKGNGWKIPKFHELNHLVEDIFKYGPPREYGCSMGEVLVQRISKYTKRWTSCNQVQIEKLVMQKVRYDSILYDMLRKHEKDDVIAAVTINRFSMGFRLITTIDRIHVLEATWHLKSMKNEQPVIPESIAKHLSHFHGVNVNVMAVIRKKVGNKFVMANSFGSGPYKGVLRTHDYVRYRFNGENYFGQLVMIYKAWITDIEHTSLRALIHFCTPSLRIQDSRITKEWMLVYNNSTSICSFHNIPFDQLDDRVDGVATSQDFRPLKPNDERDARVLEVLRIPQYMTGIL